MRRFFAAALVLAVAAPAGGCFWVTTKHEGDVLRKQVEVLQARVDAQQDTIATRVKKLKAVLAKATKLLERNSADLGAQVESLSRQNAQLNGMVKDAKRSADSLQNEVTTLQKQITDLQNKLAIVAEKAARKPAKSPGELFDEGKRAFQAGKYDAAEQIFAYLVAKYPTDAHAAEAQYDRAEAHYRQHKYESAIGDFQKVFEKYPHSSLADDALFHAGETAEKLKWCTDARAYFALLRQKYAKSPLARKARRKGRLLRREAKNRHKCRS